VGRAVVPPVEVVDTADVVAVGVAVAVTVAVVAGGAVAVGAVPVAGPKLMTTLPLWPRLMTGAASGVMRLSRGWAVGRKQAAGPGMTTHSVSKVARRACRDRKGIRATRGPPDRPRVSP
jgi:hypothetical protein